MAAHRFWRLRIPLKYSNQPYVYLGDVYLATSVGGADIAPTATVTSSSSYDYVTFSPAKVLDNDSTTFWSSAYSTYWWGTSGGMHGGEYLQFAFATAQDIVEVRARTNTVSYVEWPKNMALFWSDDGVNWTFQRSWLDIDWGSAGSTVTFPTTPLPLGAGRMLGTPMRRIGAYDAQPDAPVGWLGRSNTFVRFMNWTRPMKTSWLTGKKRIAGSTTALGLPKARTVHLLLQRTHQILDTRHTPDSGEFEFPFIADLPYTIVGEDRTAEQNSVIYANVTPVD